MSFSKKAKDNLFKVVLRVAFGQKAIPKGVADLQHYFRFYGPINFINVQENGVIIARSTNFRFGSIVTSAKTYDELDTQVKDAILTAFAIPSSFLAEADIKKVGDSKKEYAIA